ncbi:hypothetical protein, conserved [Babesia bigemina]|uniref:GINS subunit domain-containing protein n=1 Tax=Babesia bigemina TaxID=5866 RepID=A0A061D6T0_BABBI|nr:hypothetical protein, conserved [Babesia bigemina]CDR96248.1 hypothetical protein, conserved [Babesia bigemina]|eukprot:XP_012768434.1 hypothetical protein, conserved [Babesia bigemina]
MFDPDGSQSTSFDFLRKRKRTSKRSQGDSSAASDHTSISRSTLTAESHTGSTRRSSFRGILSDHSRARSVTQSQSTTQSLSHNEDYYLPSRPTVDNELCKPLNYVIWARDQMAFGNNEILARPNLEHEFYRQLEILRKKLSARNFGASSSLNILESVLELMLDVEAGFRFLGSNANPFCRLSQIYINGYTFLRPVDLASYNFTCNDEEASVTIQQKRITGNVFAHQQLLQHFARQCEYLPSKYSGDYAYKPLPIKYDYVPNLVTKVLLQRAKRQPIVVKAIVDVPGVDLSPYEGYVFEELKTGEKAWLPIYVVERLSHFGFVSVDLPTYLTRSALRELRGREEQNQTLEKLPNDYFFEIAHLFTRWHVFERVNVPNLSNRNHVYCYISKVAAIIEDIKYQRIKKIRLALDKLSMRESVIVIANLQYSETYYINQFLSAYCDMRDNHSRADLQPNIQIESFVGDLENNLLDSLNVPLL